MIPARGYVKNYHWGKAGTDNLVAQFSAVAPRTPLKKASSKANLEELNNNNNNMKNGNQVASSEPHAELWFGTHPSGPTTLAINGQMVRIDQLLRKEPAMLGVIEHYYKHNKQLPFLFKILSIAQPLSLQAHPDKKLAEVLHKRDPNNYPDSNHKPELAIALTDFHVLCDFRPYSEILDFIVALPPLRRIVGEKNHERFSQLLRHRSQLNGAKGGSSSEILRNALGECFKNLMISQRGAILEASKELISNHSNIMDKHDLTTVVTELENLYPGDPGIFAPFFLNYLKLSPGQAIYLKANKLHAYLKGECIECMACSDNVVRAGLTTKYRDVQTLTSMLDYEPINSSRDLILTPKLKHQDDCLTALFAPDESFMVERITISKRQDYELPSVKSGSFVIVLGGKATTEDFFDLKIKHKLGFGFAGFVPPKVQLKLADIQGTFDMYRAFC